MSCILRSWLRNTQCTDRRCKWLPLRRLKGYLKLQTHPHRAPPSAQKAAFLFLPSPCPYPERTVPRPPSPIPHPRSLPKPKINLPSIAPYPYPPRVLLPRSPVVGRASALHYCRKPLHGPHHSFRGLALGAVRRSHGLGTPFKEARAPLAARSPLAGPKIPG
jgi:hypothetical protein